MFAMLKDSNVTAAKMSLVSWNCDLRMWNVLMEFLYRM